MKTTKYKTIISVLNSACEEFDRYMEMSRRIELFMETGGITEKGGGMDINYIAEFAVLQDKLYKLALEKKKNESC